MSSGHPRRCIVTPFGVVSVFGLGRGVPDFGGDRRRGRSSFGVNLGRPTGTSGDFDEVE